MNLQLSGRRVLITGGGKGAGAAVCGLAGDMAQRPNVGL